MDFQKKVLDDVFEQRDRARKEEEERQRKEIEEEKQQLQESVPEPENEEDEWYIILKLHCLFLDHIEKNSRKNLSYLLVLNTSENLMENGAFALF